MRLGCANRLTGLSLTSLAGLLLLAGCGERNAYVAPPPPKVAVALSAQKPVTHYLEATGYLSAIAQVDLVARVQGFLQEIKYEDGSPVKQGQLLFVIEPEPYRLKLDQAQAAEDGAKASLTQAEAEYQRQAELGGKQFASKANVDSALAARDQARANVLQAQANTRLAKINYDYTQVTAPMDGVATTHLVSAGELVGVGATPTQLASVVRLDQIYVNFAVSEQDVQRLRADLSRRGLNVAQQREELKNVPIEVGLQTETGYPHRGVFDYAAPIVNQSTGTHDIRGILQNPDRVFLPGNFVRVRVPTGEVKDAVVIPDVALGSDLGGRYVLVVNADNVVEQRKVQAGNAVGDLRVIEGGLKANERVVVGGMLRAIPGQKVDPQVQTAAATPATQ
jgi:RND family efflux transporter MFP subunit